MMLKSSRYLQGIIPEKIPWLVATRFHIQYCKRKKKTVISRFHVIYIYIYYDNIPIKYPSIILSYSMYHLVISYIMLDSHRKIHHAIKNGKGTPSISIRAMA